MLPNLVVIGAMKSGTTSLHSYLSVHPDVFMSEQKEPTFFTDAGNWERGREWYESLFPVAASVRGESSPDYSKHPSHAGVPARMHALIPNAKLVYLVRDPVERMISHYVDAYSFGRVHQPLEQALGSPVGQHFLNCSRYFMQLEQYLDYYDPPQILVVSTEELAADRPGTLSTIFGFLGVDPTFESPAFDRVLYQGCDLRRKSRVGYAADELAKRVRATSVGKHLPKPLRRPVDVLNRVVARPIERPVLTAERRQEVIDALRPDIEALRAFTGQPFEGWCV